MYGTEGKDSYTIRTSVSQYLRIQLGPKFMLSLDLTLAQIFQQRSRMCQETAMQQQTCPGRAKRQKLIWTIDEI